MSSSGDNILASLHACFLDEVGVDPPSASTAGRHPQTMSPGALHCWRFVADAANETSDDRRRILSAEERERAACFKLPGHAERYVQTRLVLRHVLAGYVHCDPADLVLVRHPQGKPFVLAEDGTMPIRFNLSHSGDDFLLAVSLDRDVGVDVELLRPRTDPEGIAGRYFHPEERTVIESAASDDERLAAFFRCWTIKEAYVKSIGMGLRYPLSAFNVSSVMRQPDGCELTVDGRTWQCRSWQPSGNSMAAVVAEK